MKRNLFIIFVALLCLCLLSGCFHQHVWTDASCVSPATCLECGETEGEPLGHSWAAATCSEPQHCTVCGKNEGTALGHSWTAATCSEPQYCTVCGITEGTALEHSWIEATDTTPRMCSVCGHMVAFDLPESGEVFIGAELYRGSELTISSSSSECCYIKLKGTTGEDVFSFFVRAGDTVTVPVPAGYFYVYFSYGTSWYGPEYIFGSETSYAKDDEICDFENYTWSYTLYPSYNGNFSETPIDPDEF